MLASIWIGNQRHIRWCAAFRAHYVPFRVINIVANIHARRRIKGGYPLNANAATRSMKEILSAVGAKETDQTVLLSIGNEIIKLQILD